MPGLNFEINSEAFAGPLDVLLDLIEKRKLLINDVSLASVTDEYMAYVRGFEEHPVGETAEFILIASTLLLIKSKSLLPILDLTDEEERNIDDLEKRLALYQLFRDTAKDVSEQFGNVVLHSRDFKLPQDPLFVPDRYSNIEALGNAMQSVIANLSIKAFVPQAVVKKVISLEDMIKRLESRIMKQFKMSFSEFTKGAEDPAAVIVSFLAVLELVKSGFVSAKQDERFAEIHIERDQVDTPSYQ